MVRVSVKVVWKQSLSYGPNTERSVGFIGFTRYCEITSKMCKRAEVYSLKLGGNTDNIRPKL